SKRQADPFAHGSAWQPLPFAAIGKQSGAARTTIETVGSVTMPDAALVAVDVGTGSARAGVFDRDGRMLGRAERAIALHRPLSDHAETSSEGIWPRVPQ